MSNSYDKFLCWFWLLMSLAMFVVGLIDLFAGDGGAGLPMLIGSIACGRGFETAVLTQELDALKAKVG